MHGTSVIPMSKHQAAVSSGVVRVILNDLACADDLSDLRRTDHTLRPCHLLHGMGKKQDPKGCCLANLLQDTEVRVHRGYSMGNGSLVQRDFGIA